MTIAPAVIEQDEETGVIVVEIDVEALPEGTEAIQLPNGEVVNVADASNGKIRMEISEDELNEDGQLLITVLGIEETALGTYSVPVMDKDGKLLIPDTGYGVNGVAVWLWILIGIAILAVGSFTVFIILKKKQVV